MEDEKFVKIFKAQMKHISQQFILLFKGLCEINPKFRDSNEESAELYKKLESLFEEVKILAFVAAIPEEMKDIREMSRKFVERYSRPDECSLMILLEECCSYSEKKDENKTFDSHSKVKKEPENYVNNVSRVEHIRSSQFGNSRNNSGQRKGQFKIRDSRQCYNSGMIGHISRNCRKPKKRLSQGKSPVVNHVKVDSSYSRPHCLTVEIPELKDSSQNNRSSIIQKGRKPNIRKSNKSRKSQDSRNSDYSKNSNYSGNSKYSNNSLDSIQFREDTKVFVWNKNRNGKTVWLPGTILSKFGDDYKVEVPWLKTVVSREKWQLRKPNSIHSKESYSDSRASLRTKESSIRSQILENSRYNSKSPAVQFEEPSVHCADTEAKEEKKSWIHKMIWGSKCDKL
uniref:CCHC-type domain-containing protein n=1 Tax=Meloidogyne incognita TaxID=6306 RepID=A0A914MLF0_MELIC